MYAALHNIGFQGVKPAIVRDIVHRSMLNFESAILVNNLS
nr:MAG TPA: hypothetical protein [Caudoviricetes sp.]